MITDLYAVCGICGHNFGKYGVGSKHVMPACPKCGTEQMIETNNRGLKITILQTKQERKASGQRT